MYIVQKFEIDQHLVRGTPTSFYD